MDALSGWLDIGGNRIVFRNVDESRKEFSELLARIVTETCKIHSKGKCLLTCVRYNEPDSSYRLELTTISAEDEARYIETVLVNSFRLLFPGVLIVPTARSIPGGELPDDDDPSKN